MKREYRPDNPNKKEIGYGDWHGSEDNERLSPSRFDDGQEDDNPEWELGRLANLAKYAQRAAAGLPLFEEEEEKE